VYWNFFLDFGPLNLGQLYRFTIRLNQLLQDASSTILFYSSTHQAKRANAIFMICAWQVLELQRAPEEAFYGFSFYSSPNDQEPENQKSSSATSVSSPPPYPLTCVGQATVGPLPPFHDASPCACTYELTLMHCLQGLLKAKQFGFFDWDSFDVEEYEYYEQVEVRTNEKERGICKY
jgi:cell division cycle 14